MERADFIAKTRGIQAEGSSYYEQMLELQKKWHDACDRRIALAREYANEISPFKVKDIVKFHIVNYGELTEAIFKVDRMEYEIVGDSGIIKVEGRKLRKDGKTPSDANKDKVCLWWHPKNKIDPERVKEYFYSENEFKEIVENN